MDRLRTMDDLRLNGHVRRLERDVDDFHDRAVREAAALEGLGRCPDSDGLYLRLSAIHAFLQTQLRSARQELETRGAVARVRRRWWPLLDSARAP